MTTCNLDGHLTWQPERDGQPASVGKICAWGGFTVAEISEEVPHGERDEYARKFAMVDRLVEALRELADARMKFEVTARGHSCKDKTAERYKTRDQLRAARERLVSADGSARQLLNELEQPQ